jgi:hypothetical protein
MDGKALRADDLPAKGYGRKSAQGDNTVVTCD